MGSIILGGGRSSRLGQDKISLDIGGENLLERIINKIKQVHNEIILVLAQDQEKPVLLPFPDVKIVADLYSGKGPLIGIYSGLNASSDNYCLTVACDMPFLNVDLMHYMSGLASGYDAVILRVEDKVEPLHAIYSKSCMNTIRHMMEKNDIRVRNLIKRVNVRYVEESEVDSFDPNHMSWFNINTPQDLQKAEEIMIREQAK